MELEAIAFDFCRFCICAHNEVALGGNRDKIKCGHPVSSCSHS